MAKVKFIRVATNAEVENIDIVDGQFIVTGEGKTFVDFENERKSIAGTPDTEMSDVSTNSVENKVIKEYIDNKSISESGSNSNGSYIKYADGTMICYQSDIRFDADITSQYEGIYYYSTGDINFPQQFTSVPAISMSFRGLAGGGYSYYNVTTNLFNGFVWKTTSKSNATFWLYYIAIGKWK